MISSVKKYNSCNIKITKVKMTTNHKFLKIKKQFHNRKPQIWLNPWENTFKKSMFQSMDTNIKKKKNRFQ